jgi:hypothetical protein
MKMDTEFAAYTLRMATHKFCNPSSTTKGRGVIRNTVLLGSTVDDRCLYGNIDHYGSDTNHELLALFWIHDIQEN